MRQGRSSGLAWTGPVGPGSLERIGQGRGQVPWPASPLQACPAEREHRHRADPDGRRRATAALDLLDGVVPDLLGPSPTPTQVSWAAPGAGPGREQRVGPAKPLRPPRAEHARPVAPRPTGKTGYIDSIYPV